MGQGQTDKAWGAQHSQVGPPQRRWIQAQAPVPRQGFRQPAPVDGGQGQGDGGQGCEHHAPSVVGAQPGTQGRRHQKARGLDQGDPAEQVLGLGALVQIMEDGAAEDQACPGGQSLEDTQAPELFDAGGKGAGGGCQAEQN
ncbi:hypothetical protein D9M68_769550 [compost metagenome]